MSDAKPKRIQRLIDLRARTVHVAEQDLAQATMKLLEATERQRAAESAWDSLATELSAKTAEGTATIDDFSISRGHLRSLRMKADQSVIAVTEARLKESARRQVLVEAKQELKKLELWRDGKREELNQAEARKERRETDEVAARRNRDHE